MLGTDSGDRHPYDWPGSLINDRPHFQRLTVFSPMEIKVGPGQMDGGIQNFDQWTIMPIISKFPLPSPHTNAKTKIVLT
jgi:hypothetical protein